MAKRTLIVKGGDPIHYWGQIKAKKDMSITSHEQALSEGMSNISTKNI